jgi:DNA-binding HxlR family transcriptional regulator
VPHLAGALARAPIKRVDHKRRGHLSRVGDFTWKTQVVFARVNRMRRTGRNPSCPVNIAVEAVCDRWALLIVRDIVFYGKRTFGEFMASEERITTSVLADRLSDLLAAGILTRHRPETDRRRETYTLTEKGLALIPVLVDLANWGLEYSAEIRANPVWIEKAENDHAGLCRMIRNTVVRGGSVYYGEPSVVEQLATAAGQDQAVASSTARIGPHPPSPSSRG